MTQGSGVVALLLSCSNITGSLKPHRLTGFVYPSTIAHLLLSLKHKQFKAQLFQSLPHARPKFLEIFADAGNRERMRKPIEGVTDVGASIKEILFGLVQGWSQYQNT